VRQFHFSGERFACRRYFAFSLQRRTPRSLGRADDKSSERACVHALIAGIDNRAVATAQKTVSARAILKSRTYTLGMRG